MGYQSHDHRLDHRLDHRVTIGRCIVNRDHISDRQLHQMMTQELKVNLIRVTSATLKLRPPPPIRRPTRRSVSKTRTGNLNIVIPSNVVNVSVKTGNKIDSRDSHEPRLSQMKNNLKTEDIESSIKPDLKVNTKKENVKPSVKVEVKVELKQENKDVKPKISCQTIGKRKLRSSLIANTLDLKLKKIKPENSRKTVNENSVKKKNKENRNKGNSGLSRVIGLPNIGNTCYINSIIQVLRITPGFKQFICTLNKTMDPNKNAVKLRASDKQLITALHNIFVNFGDNMTNEPNGIPLESNERHITDLVDCDNIKKRFESGQQQDCHEFLNWLINELNSYAELLFPTKINRNYKLRPKAIQWKQTFESFRGVMVRKIMCSECKNSSLTDDLFEDIQIPLCDSFADVTDIRDLNSFSDIIHRKDYLKDDNKFDCRKCSKKTNASVVNSIKIAPKVMIIFIKKPLDYSQMTTRTAKPLKRLFKVPQRLDYCSERNSISYSLYGIVMHSGSDIDNGHYYAFIDSQTHRPNYEPNPDCKCAVNALANNGWIKVNDHKVTKINDNYMNRILDDERIDFTPYLAFYHQI